jgi:hypothetical protein
LHGCNRRGRGEESGKWAGKGKNQVGKSAAAQWEEMGERYLLQDPSLSGSFFDTISKITQQNNKQQSQKGGSWGAVN